ncbi:MAG: hypothetical protein CMH53_03470 [Myxococcales bacterium]|nr:hypothetical protein [Myxococcales bacterium]
MGQVSRLRRQALWADRCTVLSWIVLSCATTWAIILALQQVTGCFTGVWQLAIGMMALVMAGTIALLSRASKPTEDVAYWASTLVDSHHAEALRTAIELAQSEQGSASLRATAIRHALGHVEQMNAQVQRLWRRRGAFGVMTALMAFASGAWTVNQPALGASIVTPRVSTGNQQRLVGTLVADLKVKLTPPDYAIEVYSKSSGDSDAIEALSGSILSVSATMISGVQHLHAVIRHANDQEQKLSLSSEDKMVRWSRRLSKSLQFRFIGRSQKGARLIEKTWRDVSVVTDQPPKITIAKPIDHLEVRSDQEVIVAGQASDDIGLQRLEVVIALPNGEVKRQAAALTLGERQVNVRQVVDIESMALRPGEIATLWLECADRRGPNRPGKLSRSQRVQLTLYSPERAHRRLLEALAEVTTQWTLRLAARLERPSHNESKLEDVRKRFENLVTTEQVALKALSALIEAMHDDPLAALPTIERLKAVHRDFRQAQERVASIESKLTINITGYALSQIRHTMKKNNMVLVDKMERGIVSLLAISHREHGQSLHRQAQTLSALQDELTDVFKALKDDPDNRHLRGRAQRLLEAIDRAMKAMIQAAIARIPLAPQEAVNATASTHTGPLSALSQQSEQFHEIKEALQRGDIDQAIESMKATNNQLQATLQALKRTLRNEHKKDDSKTLQWIRKLRASINRLTAVQRDLRRQIAPLADEQHSNEARQISENFEQARLELRSLLDDARDQIRTKRLRTMTARNSIGVARARSALADVDLAFSEQQLDRALRGIGEANQSLRSTQDSLWRQSDEAPEQRIDDDRRIQNAHDRLMRLASKIRRILPTPAATLRVDGQQILDRTSTKQAKLQRRLQRTQRSMRRDPGKHPGIERRVGNRLSHAQTAMKLAQRALRNADARRGQNLMVEAQTALEQAFDQLQQPDQRRRMRLKSNANRSNGRSSSRSTGRQQPRRNAMRLKSGNTSDSGQDFRRDVMRAMKRSAPAGYDAQVREYLRALTKDKRR